MPQEPKESISSEQGHVEAEATQKFPAGTLLVREGESSRKMFVIKSGRVRIFRKYLGQHVTLAVLGDGEIFGEMSFFDGEPRSASVETLTELSAIVIDGTRGHKQISDLPNWVHTIFRTVAARFRQLDKQVTMLQSVYEFQKKSFNIDNCAKTIYSELLRFVKTTTLLFDARQKENSQAIIEDIICEAEGLLGNRYLSFRVFMGLLKEHDIMTCESAAPTGTTNLHIERLHSFEKYIEEMLRTERFLVLSHSALAILRRIAGKVAEEHLQSTRPQLLSIHLLRLEEIFGFEDALTDLQHSGILSVQDEILHFVPEKVLNVFTWQSIIKSFDYTTVKVE
jgi:CRP/FNR family cyclic AMP-dependent transcriptional regulator